MLVLSRKVGESIVIGGTVRVTITSVKGRSIQLGISAPNDVVVDRAEIHQQRLARTGDPETRVTTPKPIGVINCG